MKTLQQCEWKPFRIEDIFSIDAGVRLTAANMINGKRAFIGATDSNNGITAFVDNQNDSLDKNVLGVNYNGSVCECFYHPYEAIFSDDVKRLHTKRYNDNKYVYLFIKQCILMQKVKYQYGYKFNGERMKRQYIMLPTTNHEMPDYEYMEQYMRKKERKLLNMYKSYISHKINELGGGNALKTNQWKAFRIEEIFIDIQRGKRLKTGNHIKGRMPYVSSTSINNGVDSFINNTNNVRIFEDCLTLANSGSVGVTYYQPFAFVASDHVTKLKQSQFNKYVYLFLAVMVGKLGEKYSFNREINDKRLRREYIILPATESGLPDYTYMAQYMMEKEYLLVQKYIHQRLKK